MSLMLSANHRIPCMSRPQSTSYFARNARCNNELHMEIPNIAFQTTDWAAVVPTAHEGERGVAHWRTQHFGNIRVRIVDYSPGYLADHWCEKGHVLLCLEGELHTELKNGQVEI